MSRPNQWCPHDRPVGSWCPACPYAMATLWGARSYYVVRDGQRSPVALDFETARLNVDFWSERGHEVHIEDRYGWRVLTLQHPQAVEGAA